MDLKEKDLLEKIYAKVSNSAVLNGGFDRLVHTVDKLVEKQKESTEKLETISDTLYDPETGLYHKIKSIEFMMKTNEKTIGNIEINQKVIPEEFSKAITEKSTDLTTKFQSLTKENSDLKLELMSFKATKERLERIAGKDFEEIESAVKLTKHINRFILSFIASALGIVGMFIWTLMKK